MKLNKEQQSAIRQWFEDSGYSLSEAAKSLNAKSHVSVKNWMDKENAGIHNDTYESEILPRIKKYLEPTPAESAIPDKLNEPYKNLKYIYENDKSQFWITEHFLRNTASVIKDNAFPDKPGIKEYKPEPTIKFEVAESSLPYLRQKVSAGNGVAIVEERFHDRPDMHFMDVSGDSMLPTYKDGQKILVQLFQQRVTFGENHIPMEIVKAMIPENTVIIYERNDEGLSMKRVKYEKGSGKDAWYLKLTADNVEWAKEFKFRRIIRKTDNFIIYGKVLN